MNFRPIAGIDVGKFFSEMAILSPSNEVISRMKIHHDSNTDVERAVELLKKTEKEFASRPFVVMESTGHYHKILFHSLCKAGFEVSVTNPIQTDSIKNIGIRKVKNDKWMPGKLPYSIDFRNLGQPTSPMRILSASGAYAASTTSSLTSLLPTKTGLRVLLTNSC